MAAARKSATASGRCLRARSRPASKQSQLTVSAIDVNGLVKPRKRLVGLVPPQLNRTNAVVDLGPQGIEFKRAEVGRQGVVGLAYRFQRLAAGEVSLGVVGLDLDRRLVPLEGRWQVSPRGLDIAEPDQRVGIICVELERPSEAGVGFGEPSFELENLPQPLVRLGRAGESATS